MTPGDPALPALEFAVVRTPGELAEALAVRRAVFVEEQGVPLAEEIDEHDGDPRLQTDVVHLLGRIGARAVCTGRLQPAEPGEPEASVHITRVAVLREHRGRGLGARLMEALHSEARARGLRTAALNAQLQALGFYERLGYRAHGPVFLDAGIEHRAMKLTL
jgi:predicted GNAT family N-acyltransferase